MAICQTHCQKLPPRPAGDGCATKVRPGGINRLVFAACTVKFNNILDPLEWCDKVNRGLIVVSGELMGKKDKGSATKKRLSSCAPETVVGFERSISFTDHSSDEDFADYDFYQELQSNPKRYQCGYLTCDGRFYGFIPSFSIEVDDVIEDTNSGTTYWEGTISWTGLDVQRPIVVPGLDSILNGDCSAVEGYDTCAVDQIVAPDTNLCAEGPLELTAPFYVNTTYQWQKDDATLGGEVSNVLLVNEEGSYTCIVTREGCSPVTLDPVVVTTTRPSITDIDTGTPGSATITMTGGEAPYEITLALNDVEMGYQTVTDDVDPITYTFDTLTAGLTYTVKVRDANGCVGTDTFVAA